MNFHPKMQRSIFWNIVVLILLKFLKTQGDSSHAENISSAESTSTPDTIGSLQKSLRMCHAALHESQQNFNTTILTKEISYEEIISTIDSRLKKCSAELSSSTEEKDFWYLEHESAQEQIKVIKKDNDNAAASYQEKINAYKDDTANCRMSLTECHADLNNVVQQLKNSEEKLERHVVTHELKESSFKDKNKELSLEIKKLKRLNENLHERNRNSHSKLVELESELREMHRNAVRSYVNTTLIREDTEKFASRQMTKLYKVCGKFLCYISPHFKSMRKKSSRISTEIQSFVYPYFFGTKQFLSIYFSTVEKYFKTLYSESCSENMKSQLCCFSLKHAEKYLFRFNEIYESIRRTLISCIEQSSRFILNYNKLVYDKNEDQLPSRKIMLKANSFLYQHAEDIVYCLEILVAFFIILRYLLPRTLKFLFCIAYFLCLPIRICMSKISNFIKD
mmetsp:Transcript_15842/g.22558  ORF Transcript_15842/g.22558 Transcript_15842/m.22558 type:complete len:450 (+) Transcript_15842:100-1449(+)